MKITYFDDSSKMSAFASLLVLNELRKKQYLLICAATGGSPEVLYQMLEKRYQFDPELFEKLRVLKLDEWGGIPMSDPGSCHSYLTEKVLKPLHVSSDRYLAFDSGAEDLSEECRRIQEEIDHTGPIDCCILGLGKNGHIGFNEPASSLQSDSHIAKLSAETIEHSMVQAMSQIPSFGMTVGMKGIMRSKKILLLITGTGKQEAIKKLMDREISTQFPASFLWLHGDVECLIDKTSC